MAEGDMGEGADPSHREGVPVFDLVASKLRRPLTRPGTITRSLLIERLRRENSRPVVSVVAPAGYGKTTLLSQWAERNGQAFAWVAVDENDNDPKVLLTYVAEALDAVQPVGARVFDALTSPASSVPGSVVPRLGRAFSSMTAPVALVLDDVHLLRNRECQAALSVLADHVPGGSRMVLAGRSEPPLRVARLRAEGRILEIGAGDLSLTREEASSLLAAAEVALGGEDLAELHRRTEGWPTGLYLAALYLREGGLLPGAVVAFGGDDRFVTEYVESEFLARITRRQRAFLTRTAVLERMCGPLCEAVLDRPGSGAALAELARANLLLVPLDHRGQWYRYHHLFRDMLLAELERDEPGLVPVLQRRAAAWCLRNSMPEEALEYSIAAGDVGTVGHLVEGLMLPAYRRGRVATLQRWLRWLDDRDAIGGHPVVAVWAAVLAGRTGRPVEAERWADAVDRWQYENATRPDDPAVEGWPAVLRALLCRRGIEQMRADADEAARRLTAAGIVAPVAALFQGLARVLCGDPEAGDVFFDDAISSGDSSAPDVLAVALCERSLLAMGRGDWSLAGDLAGQARTVLRQARMEDGYFTPLICAVQARVARHRGDVASARQQLADAQRSRSLLTYAIPHLAVQARVELAGVHLALGDIAGARTLMREIDELLKRRPGLGTLDGEAQALRARLSADRRPGSPGASSLTAAELRLLPLLATHLSFPEIAADLFLSPNTIKTEAVSIYRKLGVTSRSQAVAQARELRLLEE
jgi:LuxR family maltose regulon positive regulatory protein